MRSLVRYALLLALLTSAPSQAADPLDPVGFLAGAWGTDGDVVEYWMPPLRGLMVGVNRDPQGEGAPFFEFLRIEARGEGIVYVASPRGGSPTDFRLTEVSETRAVFANPDHDFPQKLIYTLSDDRLEVEVGAERDGVWDSFKLRWTRVPCDAAAASDRDQAR